MAQPVEAAEGGTRLHVYATPRASRTQVVGLHEGRIKLQVAAPPVDGKANEAIESFLCKALGVRKRDILWLSGETGRRKTLEIRGMSPEVVESKLGLGTRT